jgi:hypothetical protein
LADAVLIRPDDIPRAVAMEAAMLALKAEVDMRESATAKKAHRQR